MPPRIIGFDGCPSGWIGARWLGPGFQPETVFIEKLSDATETRFPDIAAIAIDIPLGIPQAALPGGRDCDREARKYVGPRRSSVFPTPSGASLAADSYADACALNKASAPGAKAISVQAYALFPKLKETKKAIEASPWLQSHIIEVHPEVSFRELAGSPLSFTKSKEPGKMERRKLLEAAGFTGLGAFEAQARRHRASTDDALDACAAAWTAWRYVHGAALCFPNAAASPSYSMRIWY
jgi:predicted RNase H-like nuclease